MNCRRIFSGSGKSRRMGYIDSEGRVVVSPRFAGGFDFTEGIGVVADPDTTLMGAIGLNGEYVLEPKFSRLCPRADGVYRSSMGRGITFVDSVGLPLPLPLFRDAGDFSEGLAYVKEDVSCVKIINKIGEVVAVSSAPNLLKASEGVAPVCEESSFLFGYVDLHGNTRIPFLYAFARPFSEGLAAVTVEKGAKRPKIQAGYLDQSGTFFPVIDAIETFPYSDGVAVYSIQKNRRPLCGVIDLERRVLVPPKFELIGKFSLGLAPAKEADGKWGYIDKQGCWKLDPIYDDADPFAGSLAEVRKEDIRIYLNYLGDEVWRETLV